MKNKTRTFIPTQSRQKNDGTGRDSAIPKTRPRRGQRPRRAEKSFTLIEMLIGLSIFSIIALSLYGTFASGIALSRRSENVNRTHREIRWSLDTMTKDLERAVFYDFSKSYPDQLSFVGERDRIKFLIPTQDGLAVVSYSLKALESSAIHKVIVGSHSTKNKTITTQQTSRISLYILTREQKAFVDYLQLSTLEGSEQEALSFIVVQGGLEFSYAYLEGEEEQAKIAWQDTWSEPFSPVGVRVKLAFWKPDAEESAVAERDIYIPTGFLGEGEL